MYKQIAPRINLVEQITPRQLHKFSVLGIMYHNPPTESGGTHREFTTDHEDVGEVLKNISDVGLKPKQVNASVNHFIG